MIRLKVGGASSAPASTPTADIACRLYDSLQVMSSRRRPLRPAAQIIVDELRDREKKLAKLLRLVESDGFSLEDLRKLIAGKTQRELATALDMTQPAVSKFEAAAGDPKLSTLRKHVAALGLELVLVVREPGADGGAFLLDV
jgi:DNA-binding phage protein